uniref:Glycosyltransferase 2-like domain-containing protein n=1 Tax=viral metagenome TaxID=1070528 RepID=A0A6C0KJP3_9ZZZZ
MASDITVILTVYRRPHVLLEQLEAIQNQSIPPTSIIIWKNQYDGIELPEIPENLKKNVDIINSSRNFGVWARFAVGLLATTTYIAVFDDDTIPGNRWFENCLHCMSVKEGLYGTIGIIYDSEKSYAGYSRVGWDHQFETFTIKGVQHKYNRCAIHQVDIVGHAWFFKREWLCDLWSFAPDYSKYLTAGEDIAFSTFLQKKNIPTLVPPHPPGHFELFGSHPEKAMNYGCEHVAVSCQAGAYEKFDEVYKYFINTHGFKILNS